MSGLSPAAREYVLAFADDEHMIGARHTGWIGLGPFLEEDLAFCSIAQDELGHAIGLYRLLVDGDDELDRLALTRSAGDYRSSWLTEWPCEDWASALVRHWLYDRAEQLRWDAVAESTFGGLADLVPGAAREEAFHRRHAEQLMGRILSAPDDGEAQRRVTKAIGELRPLAASMWTPPFDEDTAVAEGVANRPFAALRTEWTDLIEADLARWTLDPAIGRGDDDRLPPDRTVRSRFFADFHAQLNEVLSIDPTAVW